MFLSTHQQSTPAAEGTTRWTALGCFPLFLLLAPSAATFEKCWNSKVGEIKLLYNLFWDVNVLCLLFISVSYFLPYDINDVFKEFIISRDTPSNHYNTRQRMIFLATDSVSVNCGPTWSLKVSLWTLWHSLGEIVGQVQSCQLCCVLRVIHLPWGAEGGNACCSVACRVPNEGIYMKSLLPITNRLKPRI